MMPETVHQKPQTPASHPSAPQLVAQVCQSPLAWCRHVTVVQQLLGPAAGRIQVPATDCWTLAVDQASCWQELQSCWLLPCWRCCHQGSCCHQTLDA